jgi:probable rRNA maturation factor
MTHSLISVTNETDIACDTSALDRLAVFLLDRLRLHPDCELAITLIDEERMTDLHVEWMDEPGPTDVLSFPMDELRSADAGEAPEQGVVGDIAMCPAVAAVQAIERGRSLDAELQFLMTHGFLHLIGYDHGEPDEQATMFDLQDAVYAEWLRFESKLGARP